MGWTDERVELLKKLWADGLSASQIAAELGGITRNAVIGKAIALQANKLFKLHLKDTVRDVMLSERLFQFYPSDEMTFRLNWYEVYPPGTCWASQLLSSKRGFLSFCATNHTKLLLHHVEPLISLQWFFYFNKADEFQRIPYR